MQSLNSGIVFMSSKAQFNSKSQMRLTVFLLLLSSFGNLLFAQEQLKQESPFPDHFINVEGIRVHYLDFGGTGLPVILVHSEARDASTYQDFGPMLTDQNRVFAITRPGYGRSESGKFDVQSQGDYLIGFADALRLDRAVFIGNASVSSELTYLAENYPDRVAGIVYLSGLSVPWMDMYSKDPNRAFEMFMRASPGGNNKEIITQARSQYRPLHVENDSITINVPALSIVSESGRIGNEKGIGALVLVGSPLMEDVRGAMPDSPVRDYLDQLASDSTFRDAEIRKIQDSTAGEYFARLAVDQSLQKEVFDFHINQVYPATIEAQDQLKKAYGGNLKLVRLDVPQIIGYEYRDNPELIIEPIKAFLLQLSED